MIHKIEVMKRCGCFTKSGMSDVYEFKTRDEAFNEVQKLLKAMNNDFCGKHLFTYVELAGNFKIVEEE